MGIPPDLAVGCGETSLGMTINLPWSPRDSREKTINSLVEAASVAPAAQVFLTWVAQEVYMYIELHCKACGKSAPIPFETLLDIWKQGYDHMCDDYKDKATVVAEITCYCGHRSKYDSPMFRYIFQLIFDEFVLNKKV